MWLKPCWSSVPSSALDLCATGWCGQGLGCMEVSGLGSRGFRKKTPLFHFSLPGFPLCLFLNPQVFLCASISPQRKAQVCLVLSSNGKQLNFIQFSPNTINHLGLTCCMVQALWRTGKPFRRARRNIKLRFLMQLQKSGIFTWLHSAAFIWKQELLFCLHPALCWTPGVSNEGFPCFTMGKLTGALTYRHTTWFRGGGAGEVVVVGRRQAVLFHCRHFYCAMCNAVGKAAKADSLGRFCMGPHQLPSLTASLASPCPEVPPCPQGSQFGNNTSLCSFGKYLIFPLILF